MPQQYTQSSNERFLRERATSGWPWRMLIFTLSIFSVALVIYLGMLFIYKPYLVGSISKTESELNQLSLQIETEGREKFIEFYSQVANLKKLLESHLKTSQFMPFLEAVTHQRVTYSSATLIAPEKSLRIEGFAASYDVLAAQLELYEGAGWVERVVLDNSSEAEQVIKFSVRIQIKDEAFNL